VIRILYRKIKCFTNVDVVVLESLMPVKERFNGFNIQTTIQNLIMKRIRNFMKV